MGIIGKTSRHWLIQETSFLVPKALAEKTIGGQGAGSRATHSNRNPWVWYAMSHEAACWIHPLLGYFFSSNTTIFFFDFFFPQSIKVWNINKLLHCPLGSVQFTHYRAIYTHKSQQILDSSIIYKISGNRKN